MQIRSLRIEPWPSTRGWGYSFPATSLLMNTTASGASGGCGNRIADLACG